MNMLQIVAASAGEMGLSVPTTVAGNTTALVVQWLALLNGLGNDLCREHQWQRITKEYRFSTVFYQYTGTTTSGSTSVTGMSSIVGLDTTFMVTGTGINSDTYVASAAVSTVVLSQAATASGTVLLTFSQTKYVMPSDFDRLIDKTDWDKSKHWEMLGPETAQQWQWLKSGFISTGPRVRFRPLGGYFQIWPPQGVADLLGFEYVSTQWVLSAAALAAGVTPDKAAFTVDTDTCVFPDRLMIVGLKKKFYEAKGFASVFDGAYLVQENIAKAAEAGSQTLSFAPRPADRLLSWANIPDSGYGS